MGVESEATALLASKLREYRERTYPELCDLTDRIDVSEAVADGARLRLEVAAVWDVDEPDAVWVYGSARRHDGAKLMVTLGFLMGSDGELLRQDPQLEQSA